MSEKHSPQEERTRDTRITLAPPPKPLRLEAGATYLLEADFSEAGRFADEDCRTSLKLSDPLAVVARNENRAEPGKQSWTLWTSPHQTYRYGYGLEFGYGLEEFEEERLEKNDDPAEPTEKFNPYGYGGRGGTMFQVEFSASVKNEGWTGQIVHQVPTKWHLQRIA